MLTFLSSGSRVLICCRFLSLFIIVDGELGLVTTAAKDRLRQVISTLWVSHS